MSASAISPPDATRTVGALAPAGGLAIDRALAPLDRVRRALLVGLSRSAVVRPLVIDRDQRIRVQAVVGAGVAFALTLLVPGVLFVVGPALFGGAHVASDVRYLALRRDLPRRWILALVAGCLARCVLGGLDATFPDRWPFSRWRLRSAFRAGCSRRFTSAAPVPPALSTRWCSPGQAGCPSAPRSDWDWPS